MTTRMWLAPWASCALWTAVASLATAGCERDGVGPSAGVVVSNSSSMWLDVAGGLLWVTSPDDDALVVLDAASLVEVERISVVGAPVRIAPDGDSVIVALRDGAELVTVGRAAPHEVHRVAIPCGGASGLAIDRARRAFVACPNDDRIVVIDLVTDGLTHVVDMAGAAPTSVAVRGEQLIVATTKRGGSLRALSLGALDGVPLRVDAALLEADRLELSSAGPKSRTASRVVDLYVDETAAFSVFQRVDNDPDRTQPSSRAGYGSVVEGDPRIEPLVASPCGARYARFDGGPRVFSGASAIAYARATRTLWVAHEYTDDVAVIDCDAPSRASPFDGARGALRAASPPEARVLATYRLGRGPRGLVLSPDGTSAYVDVGFDHAIAKLVLPGDLRAHAQTQVLVPEAERRRELGHTTLGDIALRGRSLFFDATNTHLTPSGIVTCGSCHPAGGEDGVSWFLFTEHVGPKKRRTPPAWGARAALAPFHWDGEFTDAAALSQTTIRELMGGDALLVDTEAIAEWMATEPIPPPRPPVDEAERASIARGAALFASSRLGCVTCHSGDGYTDNRPHDVLPSTADAAANLGPVQTPSLLAVRARAPFLHDGRAPTLLDVLVTHNEGDRHGRASDLSAAELEDLLAFIGSL